MFYSVRAYFIVNGFLKHKKLEICICSQGLKVDYSFAVSSCWCCLSSARDSNHFYVSVNVEARGRASFNLTYEQLLNRKLGLYNHVVNLHPGQVLDCLKSSLSTVSC